LVIIAGHLFVAGWHEALVVPFGGLLIAAAHFFNFRYTGLCRNENAGHHFAHLHAHSTPVARDPECELQD
jgi:hypothetical protein